MPEPRNGKVGVGIDLDVNEVSLVMSDTDSLKRLILVSARI